MSGCCFLQKASEKELRAAGRLSCRSKGAEMNLDPDIRTEVMRLRIRICTACPDAELLPFLDVCSKNEGSEGRK